MGHGSLYCDTAGETAPMAGGGHFFNPAHLHLLDEAVGISEEMASDFFALSTRYWLRHPYEVKTLGEVGRDDHPGDAFAQLFLYGVRPGEKRLGTDATTLYRISLNDMRILEVVEEEELRLLPFLVYLLTHELVHIVRFGSFRAMPFSEERCKEERMVHGLTREILEKPGISGMKKVLDRFRER